LEFLQIFTNGFYPGEVLSVEKNYATISFLAPITLKQDPNDLSLWKQYPSQISDIHRLENDSIFPIRPVLHISKFSNSRIVIYELLNVYLIEKFV
jgi:hypothetical protein